jgi:hypothetical protein
VVFLFDGNKTTASNKFNRAFVVVPWHPSIDGFPFVGEYPAAVKQFVNDIFFFLCYAYGKRFRDELQKLAFPGGLCYNS